jgi:hypothetical protein
MLLQAYSKVIKFGVYKPSWLAHSIKAEMVMVLTHWNRLLFCKNSH